MLPSHSEAFIRHTSSCGQGRREVGSRHVGALEHQNHPNIHSCLTDRLREIYQEAHPRAKKGSKE